MSDNIYPFEEAADSEYTFMSIGNKGSVKKIVTFEEIQAGIYNVLLQDEVNGERLGDEVVTNNDDALKVINTVATIVQISLNKPHIAAVHIAGSTEQRTKAYQRRIFRELKSFAILGQKDEAEPFEPVTGNADYVAFLILSK